MGLGTCITCMRAAARANKSCNTLTLPQAAHDYPTMKFWRPAISSIGQCITDICPMTSASHPGLSLYITQTAAAVPALATAFAAAAAAAPSDLVA
jgi:hypothetical protein